jgi:hypothetical protein
MILGVATAGLTTPRLLVLESLGESQSSTQGLAALLPQNISCESADEVGKGFISKVIRKKDKRKGRVIASKTPWNFNSLYFVCLETPKFFDIFVLQKNLMKPLIYP